MSPIELHDKENTHFNEGMFYHVFFYLNQSKNFLSINLQASKLYVYNFDNMYIFMRNSD